MFCRDQPQMQCCVHRQITQCHPWPVMKHARLSANTLCGRQANRQTDSAERPKERENGREMERYARSIVKCVCIQLGVSQPCVKKLISAEGMGLVPSLVSMWNWLPFTEEKQHYHSGMTTLPSLPLTVSTVWDHLLSWQCVLGQCVVSGGLSGAG